MLSELRVRQAKLSRLIEAAEDYARGGAKRRGRPPKWMQAPGSRNRTPVEMPKSKVS